MNGFGHLVLAVYSVQRHNGVENLKKIFEAGYWRRVVEKGGFGMKNSAASISWVPEFKKHAESIV